MPNLFDEKSILKKFQSRSDLNQVEKSANVFLGTSVAHVFGSNKVVAVFGVPSECVTDAGRLACYTSAITISGMPNAKEIDPKSEDYKAIIAIKQR